MVDKIANYGDRAVVTKINEVIDALEGLEVGGSVAWGDISGIPAALTSAQAAGTPSIRAIGTTATTAAAGNHTHTFTALTGTVSGITGANLQAMLNDISTRLAAVETP